MLQTHTHTHTRSAAILLKTLFFSAYLAAQFIPSKMFTEHKHTHTHTIQETKETLMKWICDTDYIVIASMFIVGCWLSKDNARLKH